MSLMYWMTRYPVCIYFIATGKCVPLSTFLCIIFNILLISACFSKNFCTKLPVLTRFSNSQGSCKNDLLSLWYVSEITPS